MELLSRHREEGFTLIELMVVVLIIGILVAIALPTFLGARTRSQDRAAQANLRTALVAAEAFYMVNETYTGLNAPGAPERQETSIHWVYPTSAAQMGKVTINLASGNYLVMSSKSESDSAFCIADTMAGGGGLVRGGVDGDSAAVPPGDLICTTGTW